MTRGKTNIDEEKMGMIKGQPRVLTPSFLLSLPRLIEVQGDTMHAITIPMCVSVRQCVCMYVCVNVCMYVCMFVCKYMHACMYV